MGNSTLEYLTITRKVPPETMSKKPLTKMEILASNLAIDDTPELMKATIKRKKDVIKEKILQLKEKEKTLKALTKKNACLMRFVDFVFDDALRELILNYPIKKLKETDPELFWFIYNQARLRVPRLNYLRCLNTSTFIMLKHISILLFCINCFSLSLLLLLCLLY